MLNKGIMDRDKKKAIRIKMKLKFIDACIDPGHMFLT